MANPRPTPTRLRLLTGDTSKGKNPIPKKDPSLRLKAEIPSMPGTLRDRVARDEWKRVTELLKGAGVLTRVDQRVLMLYADAFSVYREAMVDIKANGLTYTSDKGNRLANPMTHVLQTARKDMLRYLQELGMTPAARVRVEALDDAEQDELGDFLSKAT